MSIPTVLRVLGCSERDLDSVFRVGSRVYGTASPISDEDFVAVRVRRDAKQDLAFAEGVNVVVHGRETFEAAIASHSVFALECLFLPREHRLKEPSVPFSFKLDRQKLAESAGHRSEADFKKAAARFEQETAASKKKLFHSLRVLEFAVQVAERGRIVDYGAANHHWRDICSMSSDNWQDYRQVYEPLRDALTARLVPARPPRRR